MVNIEIQKGGPNNLTVLHNWYPPLPQEISSLLFNMKNFSKTDKSTAESYRIDSNLINDKEFESFKEGGTK